MLKLQSSERSNKPIVNTSYKALHPIHRMLKLYKQRAKYNYVYNVPSRLRQVLVLLLQSQSNRIAIDTLVKVVLLNHDII